MICATSVKLVLTSPGLDCLIYKMGIMVIVLNSVLSLGLSEIMHRERIRHSAWQIVSAQKCELLLGWVACNSDTGVSGREGRSSSVVSRSQKHLGKGCLGGKLLGNAWWVVFHRNPPPPKASPECLCRARPMHRSAFSFVLGYNSRAEAY